MVYGGCDAPNRGMADFCQDDPRLLSVGYPSLRDPDRALIALRIPLASDGSVVSIGLDALDGSAP